MTIMSCGGSKDNPWNPDWDKPKPEPEKPAEETGKPRYVWIDAAANFCDYENDKDRIAADLKRIKDVGFTDIIVDVRPTSGDVLFKSSVASPLKKVDVWKGSSYVWVSRTGTYDYLQTFIDEARKVPASTPSWAATFALMALEATECFSASREGSPGLRSSTRKTALSASWI